MFASSVHCLYMAGVMAIPFAIRQAVSGDNWLTVVFTALALVIIAAAILTDREYEDRETDLLRSLDGNTIRQVANRYVQQDHRPETGDIPASGG